MTIQVGDLLNKRYKVLKELKPGGFARIFEVQDIRQRNLKNGFGLLRGRSIKILKVLNQFGNHQQDAEFLFRREIGLLKQLDHPAVVKWASDFDLIHDQRIIPCLVMEKVSGVTIEEWLQENGEVSEEIALDWLLQFAEVLDYLHNEQRVMHLDIKPANVIVTPRGELVLIDFGIARPISSTLLAKLVDSGESMQHRAATDWFSAPEQLQGKPTPQSDFYSIGRTMIYVLANLPPEQLAEDDEGNISWEDSSKPVSKRISRLINSLSSFELYDRPKSSQELLNKSGAIYRDYFTSNTSIPELFIQYCPILLYSSLVALLILVLRPLYPFYKLELFVYDLTLKLRPIEKHDDRILVIEVTEEDLNIEKEKYTKNGVYSGQGSLHDQTLAEILNKLSLYNPRVVGIDVYRDNPVPNNSISSLVALCRIGVKTEVSPPPDYPLNKVGFSNAPADPDRFIRRQYLTRSPSSECATERSLSLLIAERFLDINASHESKSYNSPLMNNSDIKFSLIGNRNTVYRPQKVEGSQLLLNYRSIRDFQQIAESITLSEFLDVNSSLNFEDFINDKIILIGTTAASYNDYALTPLGNQPGVFIQAHMVSQLISHQIENRQLYRVSTYQANFLWIFIWTVFIMIMIGRVKTTRKKITISLLFMLLSLFISYLFICFLGYWIPSAILSLTLMVSPLVPVNSKNPRRYRRLL